MAGSEEPPPRPRARQPQARQPQAGQPQARQPQGGQPKHLPGTEAAKAVREARLAEEMRKNLRKRKARQRALQERGEPD